MIVFSLIAGVAGVLAIAFRRSLAELLAVTIETKRTPLPRDSAQKSTPSFFVFYGCSLLLISVIVLTAAILKVGA
ncbi:hypothetical protein N1031_03320 [Herbiconiux moechotypicola]|uniref:Uncharacterized protein n=1 Tax=Herbiconiux moechotypicola TaxID=637393 RepID=A0ABP5Q9Z7_9MICO|nr:hypothetical protein [Herbiconiux moechotypicola]MCS5728779.1 hypothetical protein [Herbiconiux moechotypicola]